MRYSLAIVASALLVAGCQQDRAQLAGLSSGEDITFNLVPDGSGASILYDTARVEATATAARKPGETVSQTRRFTLVTPDRKSSGRFWVRGAAEGKADTAKLTFSVAGKSIDLTPRLVAGNFTICFDAALASNETPVSWQASVEVPPDGETALLDIDSIDLLVGESEAPPMDEKQCPSPPEELGEAAKQSRAAGSAINPVR